MYLAGSLSLVSGMIIAYAVSTHTSAPLQSFDGYLGSMQGALSEPEYVVFVGVIEEVDSTSTVIFRTIDPYHRDSMRIRIDVSSALAAEVGSANTTSPRAVSEAGIYKGSIVRVRVLRQPGPLVAQLIFPYTDVLKV